MPHALLPIQFFIDEPGKAPDNGQNAWFSTRMWKILVEFTAPGFNLDQIWLLQPFG